MKRRQILTTGSLAALAATVPLEKAKASFPFSKKMIPRVGHLRKEILFDLPPHLAKVESVYKADLWIYNVQLPRDSKRSEGVLSYGGKNLYRCFAEDITGSFDNAKIKNVQISAWEDDQIAFCDKMGIYIPPDKREGYFGKNGTISDLMLYRNWKLFRGIQTFQFHENDNGGSILPPTFNEIWVGCLDGWVFYIEQIRQEQDSEHEGPRLDFLYQLNVSS